MQGRSGALAAMKELKAQFVGAWLVTLTVAAIICAALSYQQQKKWPLPDDGVTWMDQETNRDDPKNPGRPSTVVVAVYVAPGGPGEKAGIHAGDVLRKVNGTPVENSLQVAQLLLQIGADQKAFYAFERAGYEVNAKVFVASALRDNALYLQYLVGIAYLSIGLFVYLRRGRAPRSAHFYVLCLASFVHFTFHYTGKLNAFDTAIYIGNVVAGLLAPALFLHFCFVFRSRGGGGAPPKYCPFTCRPSRSWPCKLGWQSALSARPCRYWNCAGCSIARGFSYSPDAIWGARSSCTRVSGRTTIPSPASS
jgi:two-component system, NtrC family, sensor kinase